MLFNDHILARAYTVLILLLFHFTLSGQQYGTSNRNNNKN
jgi:hypothetical protein